MLNFDYEKSPVNLLRGRKPPLLAISYNTMAIKIVAYRQLPKFLKRYYIDLN